jgi:hypothetical protein
MLGRIDHRKGSTQDKLLAAVVRDHGNKLDEQTVNHVAEIVKKRE